MARASCLDPGALVTKIETIAKPADSQAVAHSNRVIDCFPITGTRQSRGKCAGRTKSARLPVGNRSQLTKTRWRAEASACAIARSALSAKSRRVVDEKECWRKGVRRRPSISRKKWKKTFPARRKDPATFAHRRKLVITARFRQSSFLEGAQGRCSTSTTGIIPNVTFQRNFRRRQTLASASPTKIKTRPRNFKAYTTRVRRRAVSHRMPDLDAQAFATGKEFGAVTGRPRRRLARSGPYCVTQNDQGID